MASRTSSSASASLISGCQPITWTPRQTKSDPVPPLPPDIRSSPLIAATSSATTSQILATSQQDDLDDDVDSFDLPQEVCIENIII